VDLSGLVRKMILLLHWRTSDSIKGKCLYAWNFRALASVCHQCSRLQPIQRFTLPWNFPRSCTFISSCLWSAGSQHSVKPSDLQRPGSIITGCFEPWHSLTRWQFARRSHRTRSPYRHRHVREAILCFRNLLHLRFNDATMSFIFKST
jgi:hypothetical protein